MMETQESSMPVSNGTGTVELRPFPTIPEIGMTVTDERGDRVYVWLTPNEARQLAALIQVHADGLDPAGA